MDIPAEGDAVKKAHGVDGDVDAGGRLVALLDEVVRPVGDLLIGDLIRRAPVVAGQISDVAGVGLLGACGPATDGQVPNIFCSKWCHRPAMMAAMQPLVAPAGTRRLAPFAAADLFFVVLMLPYLAHT